MRTFHLRLFSALTLIVMVVGSGAAMVSAASPAAHLALTASYTADNATVFSNPERGFHNRYEIIDDVSVNDYASAATSIAGFNPDAIDRTFARAKASGNTIIHSYLHLDKYKTTDVLPQALLNNLSSGLAAIRTAGLKIVLRPAYTWSEMPSVPEARIIGHISQINTVISANADVVAYLESGYLGPWGEWHSSLYTDYTKQSEGEIRYRIVKKLLDTTPASMPIVIRYPMALKEALEIPTPAGSAALTQTDRDRLGFHNDCFLYNEADRGTYDKVTWLGTFSIAQQQQYVFDLNTSYGGNKMVGGETCDGNGRNDAGAVTVQSEMAALNFTEINVDFWDGAINLWKAANLSAAGNDPAETAFVRLQRKMGYRLRLVDATFPTSATAGGSFTFSANLSNNGYAGIIKPRPIFLVLESGSNRFNLQMSNVDVRKWIPGANSLAQQTVTLPSNIPAGTYKLALWLPDSASGLQSRPEYSIRLANQGIWDTAMGYNVLSNAITITGGGGATATSMPTYTRTPTPTLTPTPTSTPSGYAAYEAESGSNTLAGGATVSACSTCSGGNKVGNVGNNAGTLQFNSVNGASAGNYTLTIYYINGDTAARNATISVNGGAGSNISFPVTGSWTTVGSLQTTISLNAGSSNTIKFSNTSGWAPDFDRVTIALNGGPTNTPGAVTNTPTKTNTPPMTNTPVGPTNTSTRTNTPSGPTPTVGASSTPTIGASPTRTNTPGPAGLKVQYMASNTNPSDSAIAPSFLIVNTSGVSIPLSELKLRYWYTIDSGVQTQTFNCNWIVVGCANTTSSFVAMSSPVTNADHYMELAFTSAAGSIAAGGNGGDIQVQINKTDNSTQNESNDYSFDATKTAYTDWSKVTLYRNGALVWGTEPTGGTPVSPTMTLTRTNTPVAPTPTNTAGASATPTSGANLLLDNFDGVPVWSTGTTNDLGRWAGANGFVNGTGGAGVETGGGLVLQYNNSGWFGSDVMQDVSSKTYLVFVIKGATGGEQNAFHVSLGGVENTFAALSGDTITTAYKTIRINMAANGINRVSPGQLNMTFWWGSTGTITIDEIRFE